MIVRRALALGVALLLAAAAAHAFVPKASRVAKALADANKASKRTQALQLEMSLRIGDGEPIADGEIVTHPTGLARLELRGASDLVERHLLRGTEHLASRNGRPLSTPRAFLPPLFLLQADSALTLRAALESFGVVVQWIGLAPCGQRDCFVLGDPEHVAPPKARPAPGEELPPLEPRTPPDPHSRPGRPVVWLDRETYEVVRIDSGDGVRVTLGPAAAFDQVRFPQWIRIEEPGQRPVRFDIKRATPVNAPPTAFGDAWLMNTEPGPTPAAGADASETTRP